MDKIALIKTEIERRIRELDEQIVDIYDSKAVLRKNELQRLLSFLDTLSEEPDKSLDEAAADFVWDIMENDYYGPSKLSKSLRPTSKLDDFYGALAEIFIAGAKWQKGQLLKGSPLPEDTVLFQKGVEEGRRLEMEDIMKDAVEKTVGQLERQWGGNIHFMHGFEVDEMDFPFLNSQECVYGDKVRIIVCKKKD